MPFTTRPASDHTSAELAALFNRGFEEYFIPVNLDGEHFSVFVTRDGINLSLSRILLHENQPIGLGLISSREDASRLAAMGIVKDWRNKGTGTWLLESLMNEARQRGEIHMGLEVIVQNEPAVHLYEKFGFRKVRQLFGFTGKEPVGVADPDFLVCTLKMLTEQAERSAIPDLPWQVDVEAVRQNPDTTFCFQLNNSFIATTNPEGEQVFLRILVSEDQIEAENLLRALFANYPGRTWHVPAIFPEEQAPIFENVGMETQEISQWQMLADL